eukprot:gene26969-34741_t
MADADFPSKTAVRRAAGLQGFKAGGSPKQRNAPGAVVFQTTSHDLLAALADPTSAPSQTLAAHGWHTRQFDVVWLDYCGTFDSRPGRKRKKDVELLLAGRLLARPGLLAVTLSQRGGAQPYRHSTVDDALGYCHWAAAAGGAAASLAGVVCYLSHTVGAGAGAAATAAQRSSSKKEQHRQVPTQMYTVALVVSDAADAATAAEIVAAIPEPQQPLNESVYTGAADGGGGGGEEWEGA